MNKISLYVDEIPDIKYDLIFFKLYSIFNQLDFKKYQCCVYNLSEKEKYKN